MCVQSVMGVVISACMAGIVFAKLARPKARSHTVMFSKNAVISQRNGHYWLLFRVGNMRKSHLIETHMRAQLVNHHKATEEGESLSYEVEELKLTTLFTGAGAASNNPVLKTAASDSEGEEEEMSTEDRTLFFWPFTVAHRIDRDSPFYEMGPREVFSSKFELIVTLEGIVEPTGNSVQSRSSYLPNEILWGHRFEKMMSYDNKVGGGSYVVDCSNLNAVIPDETPKISRKAFEEKQKLEAKRLQKALLKMDARGMQNKNPNVTVTTGNNVTTVSTSARPMKSMKEEDESSSSSEDEK